MASAPAAEVEAAVTFDVAISAARTSFGLNEIPAETSARLEPCATVRLRYNKVRRGRRWLEIINASRHMRSNSPQERAD